MKFLFVLLVATILVVAGSAAGDELATEAQRFAGQTVEVEPASVAHRWRLPFATTDRSRRATVRLVSRLGAPRISYKRGHLHTGADLAPCRIKAPVQVLPMAPGAVCSIHLAAPHTTVVVKHLLPSGATLYTSYKHLTGVAVEPGQQVTPDTPLGRLYTRAEALELGARYDHLHLEVRQRFDDHGVASWLTMTRAALKERFQDPWAFLSRSLTIPRPMP